MKKKIMFALAFGLTTGIAMAEDVINAGKPIIGPWYQDLWSYVERVFAFVM